MAAEGVCSWGGPKILGDPGRYWAQSDGCPQPYGWGGPVPPRPPQFRRLWVWFVWNDGDRATIIYMIIRKNLAIDHDMCLVYFGEWKCPMRFYGIYAPVANLIASFNISHSQYADDTQHFIASNDEKALPSRCWSAATTQFTTGFFWTACRSSGQDWSNCHRNRRSAAIWRPTW